MKQYIVCARNGCGDHVSLVIKAENTKDALEKAYLIDNFPKDWEDIRIQITNERFSYKYPEWLVDIEGFDHEQSMYNPPRFLI